MTPSYFFLSKGGGEYVGGPKGRVGELRPALGGVLLAPAEDPDGAVLQPMQLHPLPVVLELHLFIYTEVARSTTRECVRSNTFNLLT